MALSQRIADDTKAALLGGDRFVAGVLRNLKAAILNEEVAQNRRDEGLDDAEIEKIIAREVKKRQESMTLYEQNDRQDLADVERSELEVLKAYLPEQLSEAEVLSLVSKVITDTGATSPAQMGQVIGQVKSQAGNSADGALIARLVKEQLNK